MESGHQTFFVFEQNVQVSARLGIGQWPLEFTVPELSDGGGSFGTIYHLMARDGMPVDCCLKVFKDLVRPLSVGASPLDAVLPASWKRPHDEYDKLVRLNGLEGRAPAAFAYGVVVQPSHHGTSNMRPAFLMEDLSGDFKRLGDIAIPRATADVAACGLDLLKTISLLRDRRIAHADFSEGNIMVRLSEDGSTVVATALVDFGQGKESTEGVTPGGEQVRLGTMPFAAPEILPLADQACGLPFAEEHRLAFESRNRYTVDVWSLGAVLFLLKTGAKPKLPASYSSDRGCYVDAAGRTISQDRAFESIIGEKRAGLRLDAGFVRSPQDEALDEAIRVCTSARPADRDLCRIEELLRLAAMPETDFDDRETPPMEALLDEVGTSGDSLERPGSSEPDGSLLDRIQAALASLADGGDGPSDAGEASACGAARDGATLDLAALEAKLQDVRAGVPACEGVPTGAERRIDQPTLDSIHAKLLAEWVEAGPDAGFGTGPDAGPDAGSSSGADAGSDAGSSPESCPDEGPDAEPAPWRSFFQSLFGKG